MWMFHWRACHTKFVEESLTHGTIYCRSKPSPFAALSKDNIKAVSSSARPFASGTRSMLSPSFVFEYKDGTYTFTSKGRGHGVGLSQYGANQMALTGSNYREILAHYYKGAKLEKN